MTEFAPASEEKRLSLLWAGVERADDIAALHARLFDPPWDSDSLRGLLNHPAGTAFVATLAQPRNVVGFILGQLAGDEAEILTIGVHPDCQRLGIGRLLVDGLIRALQRAEAQRVFLEVAADNAAALGLYQSLGFTQVGTRKAYYARPAGPAVDAIMMARAIAPA